MSTQMIPGFMGKVYVQNGEGYVPIAEVRDATLTISQAEIDATSFDSGGWEEYIPGLKSWEVEAEAVYVPADAAQSDLFDALVNGQTVQLRLAPKDGSGNEAYEGNAFVTSWEINNPSDDGVVLSISFRGTGALTKGTIS